MRYPSYLISWSQSGPRGGASTSSQSCGLTHFGSPLERPFGMLVINFGMIAGSEALVSYE